MHHWQNNKDNEHKNKEFGICNVHRIRFDWLSNFEDVLRLLREDSEVALAFRLFDAVMVVLKSMGGEI